MDHQVASQIRQSWDKYFLGIALEVAKRSTCNRKHVGAVIVRDRSILATGYNGSIRGMPHCDDVGHLMVNGHCIRTVHAEANAVAQAARNGVRIEGATVYVTALPCFDCFKLIANACISRIVYDEFYRGEQLEEMCKTCKHLSIHLQSINRVTSGQ
jgi:dCMP deaminase